MSRRALVILGCLNTAIGAAAVLLYLKVSELSGQTVIIVGSLVNILAMRQATRKAIGPS